MALRFFLFVVFLLAASAARGNDPVLTLAKSFEMAFARSETLAIGEQDVRIAEARYLQVLGTVLPHINVDASELIQDTAPTGGGGDNVGQTFTRRSRPEVAVNLRQPLFQGFREFNALKVSGAEKSRNLHRWNRARQLLMADVARAYDTVLELEQEVGILQSLRGTLLERSSEIRQRIELGKSRESERLTTESEAAAVEADIEERKGLAQTARDLLGFLIGEQPIASRLVDEFAVPRLKPLEDYLAKQDLRPDVNASEEAVRLARGQLAYEKGARYPSLDLDANYYPYRVGFQSDIDWDVNFLLTVPIFHGGAIRGRVREAKAELKQSELMRNESWRRAELEIRQAYHRLAATRAREAALKKAEAKSAANYRSLVDEYGLGLVNNLEVLQSLKDWQQRRVEANRAHYETQFEYLGLLIATGDMELAP